MRIPSSPERALYEMFAPGVAYVAVEDAEGKPAIGTCFHIGDSVFVTARHVVEHRKITKIATTVGGVRTSGGMYFGSWLASEAKRIEGPFFHPNPNYDLAAVRLDGVNGPQIPFLPVSNDSDDDEHLLRKVVVMGYPPIPGSRTPVLVCTLAEVNASFVTYFDNQKVLVVSCLARGGFSGGPALTLPHNCLGVVTRAMLRDPLPEELGFMAIVGPWPVLELLNHHGIMPIYLRKEMWEPRHKATK